MFSRAFFLIDTQGMLTGLIHLSAGRSTHTHNVYLPVTHNIYVCYGCKRNYVMFITYLRGKQHNVYHVGYVRVIQKVFLRYDLLVRNLQVSMHRVYNVHILMRKNNIGRLYNTHILILTPIIMVLHEYLSSSSYLHINIFVISGIPYYLSNCCQENGDGRLVMVFRFL